MHTAAGPSNQVQPGRQAPIPDGEGGVYARRRCDDLSGGVHHRLGEVMLKGIVGKQVCDAVDCGGDDAEGVLHLNGAAIVAGAVAVDVHSAVVGDGPL